MKFVKYCITVIFDLFAWLFSLISPQLKKNGLVCGLIALIFLLQWSVLARASNSEVGDYVVYQQGQLARTGAEEIPVDLDATKQKIALFASSFVRSGYDWKQGQFITEDGISYPTSFYAASFYFDMHSGLRQKWLISRAVGYQKSKFGFEKFLKGAYASKVELSGTPIVRQVSNARWEAEVHGVRYVVSTKPDVEGAAFKERLSFRFIIDEVPPNSGQAWGLESDPLNTILNKVQSDGLRIMEYTELRA